MLQSSPWYIYYIHTYVLLSSSKFLYFALFLPFFTYFIFPSSFFATGVSSSSFWWCFANAALVSSCRTRVPYFYCWQRFWPPCVIYIHMNCKIRIFTVVFIACILLRKWRMALYSRARHVVGSSFNFYSFIWDYSCYEFYLPHSLMCVTTYWVFDSLYIYDRESRETLGVIM